MKHARPFDDIAQLAHITGPIMLHQPRQRRFIKMRDLLIESIAALPEREAIVLQLFFIEELNLQEIGTMMGVGAARICQIKKAALGKLRFRLEQAL